MDMMATFFPSKHVPLRVSSVNGLEGSDKICVAADCGNSNFTFHSVTPAEARAFAVDLIARIDKFVDDKAADKAALDAACRPQREFDPVEMKREHYQEVLALSGFGGHGDA